MSQLRNFCFTSYTIPIDHNTLSQSIYIKYMVLQLEQCPETGKQHYQGYVELKNSKTVKQIKKMFNDNTIHIEKRKGNAKQASDYCKKVDTRIDGPWEYGTISKHGSRTDIHDLVKVSKEAKCYMEVVDTCPEYAARYHRFVKDIIVSKKAEPRPNMEIILLYGRPGWGKTTYVQRKYPDAYIVTPPSNKTSSVWYDGYTGQDTIIFDEYNAWLPFNQFKMLTGGTPFKLQVKGGFVNCCANRIVFTSNKSPLEWYSTHKDYNAWLRRIHNFGKDYSDINPPPDFYELCPDIPEVRDYTVQDMPSTLLEHPLYIDFISSNIVLPNNN